MLPYAINIKTVIKCGNLRVSYLNKLNGRVLTHERWIVALKIVYLLK